MCGAFFTQSKGKGKREVHNKLDIICRKYEKNKNTESSGGCPRVCGPTKERLQIKRTASLGNHPKKKMSNSSRAKVKLTSGGTHLETVNWLTKGVASWPGCVSKFNVSQSPVIRSLMLCPVWKTGPLIYRTSSEFSGLKSVEILMWKFSRFL